MASSQSNFEANSVHDPMNLKETIEKYTVSAKNTLYGFSPLQDLFGLLHFNIALELAVVQAMKMLNNHRTSRSESRQSTTCLRNLFDILKTWRPSYEHDHQVIEEAHKVNLVACFNEYIGEMKYIVVQFRCLLDQSQQHHCRDLYIQYITDIIVDINFFHRNLILIFSSCPAPPINFNVDFHYSISFTVNKLFDISHADNRFDEACEAFGLPPLHPMIAYNSPILGKLLTMTHSDVIQAANDTVCVICYQELNNGQCLGILTTCNHVCCDECQDRWLRSEERNGRSWSCSYCRTKVHEWGKISPNGWKTCFRMLVKEVEQWSK